MDGGGPARRRLDHVGLPVTDLGAAVEFFVSRLQAELVFRLEPPGPGQPSGAERLGQARSARFGLAMLELGGARLELVEWRQEGPPRGPAPISPGGHAAVEVEDVPAALQALRELPGVVVLGEPATFSEGPTPGLTNAFLRVPGGVLLELVRWPDVGSAGGCCRDASSRGGEG